MVSCHEMRLSDCHCLVKDCSVPLPPPDIYWSPQGNGRTADGPQTAECRTARSAARSDEWRGRSDRRRAGATAYGGMSWRMVVQMVMRMVVRMVGKIECLRVIESVKGKSVRVVNRVDR